MKSFTNILILTTLLAGLMWSCNQKSDEMPQFPDAPDSTQTKDSATLSKILAADSVYALQQQFNTIHQHGKDLAVHAHQNIPKKRRLLKEAATIRPARMEAYKRARARREERIKNQLKESEEDAEW